MMSLYKKPLGNPQGKGVVPLLAAWDALSPSRIEIKSAEQILSQYFTSLLVLSAEFHFKPVPQQDYYLYWKNAASGTQWRLSLIEPEKLGDLCLGQFVGRCHLQSDMTWTIQPSQLLAEQEDVLAALQHFAEQFQLANQNGQSLERLLPFFVDELPFYRRLSATALSSSLSRSIAVSDLSGIPAQQWLEQNPSSMRLLLQSDS
tara:strand:- start:3438 stop:4046 length:609 start_codon:yes stop_codon:yes gene_type:complete